MSAPNFTSQQLAQLELFMKTSMANPNVLHMPNLSFVKTFIEHFGGKLPEYVPDKPTAPKESQPEEAPKEPEAQPESEEEEESDLELDMTGVIEPDKDEPHQMGDVSIVPKKREIAKSQTKRSEAVSAFVEKDYNKAIQLYTDAIMLNPQAAVLYAKRGQVFLLLNKPNACIRDCDRALQLNPDSAAAYKFRGRAYHLLGKFEEAATDLRLACKFDFDEQADEWLREVTPNAKKIEEHKRKYERRQQEKTEREKQEKIKKAGESRKNEGATDGSDSATRSGQFQFQRDHDVPKTFQVPKAFADISQDPRNILKYQNDPEVMMVVNAVAARYARYDERERQERMAGFPSEEVAAMSMRLGEIAAAAAAVARMSGTASPTKDSDSNSNANANASKFKPQDDFGLD